MKKLLLLVAGLSLLVSFPLNAQSFGDTIVFGGPGNCGGNVSANFVVGAAAGAGTGLQAVGTNFTPVYQAASSGAATDIIACGFSGMSRSTAGKGLNAVAGIAFFYGIVTTAASSESAPVCAVQTMPVPNTGETASTAAGTVVAQTSVPVIGSANLGAVTTGQFFTTYLAFTTQQAFNGLYQSFSCAFTFVQGGAAAMQLNTPGYIVFTTNTIALMKKYGHDRSVRELASLGISKETSELMFAHYMPKDPQAIAYMTEYNIRHDKTRWAVVNGCDMSVAGKSCFASPELPAAIKAEVITSGPVSRKQGM